MSRTVAVLGASRNREKFGNKAVRAFAYRGYRVIPINLRPGLIEGIRVFTSVLSVPDRIDLATVYLQPSVGRRVMKELAQKGIPEVWLNPGADGEDVAEMARAVGLEPILDCCIVGIGESPASYPSDVRRMG